MGYKMLVIDDDLGVLDMVGDYFRFCGFQVHTAEDGLSGIEICQSMRPDVILLDLRLRRMHGSEAVPYFRNIVPGAKIFVVSGHSEDLQENRISGLAVDGYFEKPVLISELQTAIQSALNKPAVPSRQLRRAFDFEFSVS